MISKYNGTCRYCGQATQANKDQYDLDSKTSYHAQCEEDAESQPATPAQYAIAEGLGFVHVDIDRPAEGLLRRMLRTHHGGPAGRPESAPHRRPIANLFGEE